MGYYMRYFADGAVTLKQIGAGLKGLDPQFKIDAGELMYGTELLGELEITSAGSDLFGEDLATHVANLGRVRTPQAQQVIGRLRGTQAIVALHVLDGERDPDATWQMIGPLWSVLPTLATGLIQSDGQGWYDGGQLIVQMG